MSVELAAATVLAIVAIAACFTGGYFVGWEVTRAYNRRRARGRKASFARAPCTRYWADHPPLVDALGYAAPLASGSAPGCPLRRGRRSDACGGPPAHAHDPYLARDPGAAAAFEADYCRFAPAFCSGGALEP